MKDFLKKAMSGTDGLPSTTRIVFLFFGLLFTFCFCIVWTYVSLSTKALSDIPSGTAGMLGGLFAGKGIQTVAELWSEKKKQIP
jgi:hypothetical protein